MQVMKVMSWVRQSKWKEIPNALPVIRWVRGAQNKDIGTRWYCERLTMWLWLPKWYFMHPGWPMLSRSPWEWGPSVRRLSFCQIKHAGWFFFTWTYSVDYWGEKNRKDTTWETSSGNAGPSKEWQPLRSSQEANLRSRTIRKDLPVGRIHTHSVQHKACSH